MGCGIPDLDKKLYNLINNTHNIYIGYSKRSSGCSQYSPHVVIALRHIYISIAKD